MIPAISRALVEQLLLGPTGDRRQLQDSPILGDVWIAFAENPSVPQELLITPHRDVSAGEVAMLLDELVDEDRQQRKQLEPRKRKSKSDNPEMTIAYLQGIVAARFLFHDVLRVLVPRTGWWQKSFKRDLAVFQEEDFAKRLEKILRSAVGILVRGVARSQVSVTINDPSAALRMTASERYIAMSGIILWTATYKENFYKTDEFASAILKNLPQIIKMLTAEFSTAIMSDTSPSSKPIIHQIAMNRRVELAVSRSVPAVKADAARTLFTVDCSKIAWAVIDSGIKGDHPAFCAAQPAEQLGSNARIMVPKNQQGPSRVQAAYDFSNFRQIVNTDNLRLFTLGSKAQKNQRLARLLDKDLRHAPKAKEAVESLVQLATDNKLKRPLHWECVWPFIEINTHTSPAGGVHGTHVAGILGASRAAAAYLPEDQLGDYADGMCPDIKLYDFRVIGEATGDTKDTEFAVIAALQFIRYLNDRKQYMTIHGANLSLSIPHDVRNYACGRTPVCNECERLVESGVVVVAAAGNFGYQRFETNDGIFDGYAAFSVTDPGNSDDVITVGSTHRYSPHTYGVSFFSSRGPTGDGRLKPDLVAPGERIMAPFIEGWGELDGTSMAAPHVSGAAAMLMARYSELIGRPRRIKQILCDSATDLGRERTFQGRGMLDVLRAFQSL